MLLSWRRYFALLCVASSVFGVFLFTFFEFLFSLKIKKKQNAIFLGDEKGIINSRICRSQLKRIINPNTLFLI